MKKRIETLADGVTLHLGDCQSILPTLPKHDALDRPDMLIEAEAKPVQINLILQEGHK